ncbi:hypothetical protein GCM10007385_09120 [Tateyamaria omphalii]|uniref:hypothetical protein n=1 Tax=Tateyamaria omphalii TaxID=299262 RepID=UPI00167AD5D4|nr:hypothetical protein [Tateyamaria omphalii]GGX43383.1 hypothetical protein GCM10007385_09120 [Tateyamaria omphalii]
MSPDYYLVFGILLAGFSIPSVLSAISDRRAPRASAITILIAGGLILLAIQTKPGGYSIEEIPDVFVRVIAAFI